MSAAFAPSPWPAPVPSNGTAWHLGRLRGTDGSGPGVQWDLRRNCTLSPAQMGSVYLSLCLLSMVIAVPFAVQGATVVLAFAGLELLAVGSAMLVYARHAGDGDTLTLCGHSLQVEQTHGSRVSRTEFRAEWVSVEPAQGEGSLVEVAGQGQRVRVGRFLRPHLRPALARELRLALRSALARPTSVHPD